MMSELIPTLRDIGNHLQRLHAEEKYEGFTVADHFFVQQSAKRLEKREATIAEQAAELKRRADVIYWLEDQIKYWMSEGQEEESWEDDWRKLISIKESKRTKQQTKRLKEIVKHCRREQADAPELRKEIAEQAKEIERLKGIVQCCEHDHNFDGG